MTRHAPLLLVILLSASAATAAEPTAKQLFDDGVALFNGGKIDAACKKFEASYGLKDEPGTLFNLAACHEKQNRYFEARAEFDRLAGRMDEAGKADKAAIARERAEQAAKHAPRLELVFSASSNVERIEIDGKPLAAGEWKRSIFVSPGSHELVFSAEGKTSAKVGASAENDRFSRVPVPVLQAAQSQATATVPVATTPGPEAEPPREAPPAHDHEAAASSSQRTIGMVLAGVGVVGLGVGTVFGLKALSQKSDADDACGSSSGACPTDSQTKAASDQIKSAKTSATISTVGFAAGAGFIAVGAYLFFSGRKADETPIRSGVRVIPAGPGKGGISVIGAF